MATPSSAAATVRQLGATVRRLRLAARLSQETYAERCELSARYVSNIERGTQEARVFALRRLAAGLGLSASALLRRAGF